MADLTDIRTIFWVIGANSNNAGFLLGDDDKYIYTIVVELLQLTFGQAMLRSHVISGNLAINGSRNINGETT